MSSFVSNYIEYPILCKGCNELVDCRKHEFLDHLESGLTMQESLDKMGIIWGCTREAFMNPHTEDVDCRNEDLIEGNIEYKIGLQPHQKFIYLPRYDPPEIIWSDKLPTQVGMPELQQDPERPWAKRYIGSGQYGMETNGRLYFAT